MFIVFDFFFSKSLLRLFFSPYLDLDHIFLGTVSYDFFAVPVWIWARFKTRYFGVRFNDAFGKHKSFRVQIWILIRMILLQKLTELFSQKSSSVREQSGFSICVWFGNPLRPLWRSKRVGIRAFKRLKFQNYRTLRGILGEVNISTQRTEIFCTYFYISHLEFRFFWIFFCI